ncbi:hypothetical protein EDC04DRAFT_2609991 [Pisolithus marmoratus]|nr:hypothetical protein EDC04DRAFT_2609991 [Pisolithus marmoratus]
MSGFSKSQGSAMKQKGSHISAELLDLNEYIDDDGFDSMPFTDVHTTYPGPSGQHQKGGKLKSALKILTHGMAMPLKGTKPLTIDKVTEALLQKKWYHGKLPKHAEHPCCQMPMLPLCHLGNCGSTRFQGVMEEQPKSGERLATGRRLDIPWLDKCIEGHCVHGPIYTFDSQGAVILMETIILSSPSHMSDQQEQRVHFYHQVDIVPISPHQQGGPSSVPVGDDSSSCSESRDLLERMKNAEVPTPPVSLVHVLAKPPSKAPKPNLFKRMKNAEVPTPPMSRVHTLAKPPSEAPKPDLFERMRNVEVPTLPAALPASWRATIPQAPSPTEAASLQMSIRMPTAEVPQQSSPYTEVHVNQGNAPDHGYRVNFGDPDWRWLGALFSYALAICQQLMNISFCNMLNYVLQKFKSWHNAVPPPISYPFNLHLDGHIVQAMKWLAVDILQCVMSQVKSLQVGQYTMDMLDLLELGNGCGCANVVGETFVALGPGFPLMVFMSSGVQWL